LNVIQDPLAILVTKVLGRLVSSIKGDAPVVVLLDKAGPMPSDRAIWEHHPKIATYRKSTS